MKSFGKTVAVDGIDLSIARGGVHAVLGPNGAGKTTTIRILSTLMPPDAGSARVLGRDVVTDATQVRRRVSLTGQFASVDEDLTGSENLRLIGRLFGYTGTRARQRAAELLEAFNLSDVADRQVKKYSGGMRRRLDIAASITVTPELLFLDEPTTGLDPRSRGEVWDIVRAMVTSGTTVLLTTQYLEEADQLADRISVIDHGKVVAGGTSTELKTSIGTATLNVRLQHPDDHTRATNTLSRVLTADARTGDDLGTVTATIDDPSRVGYALTALHEAGVMVSQVTLGQPSLDEVFLAITGHKTETDAEVAA
ncbi:ATP-binding cassette domain-containing protein [Microbacterium sp.]|uniref:ATP-binding cassette domain-containing protein n=1 Tax=Microbacterium sp. TaxID=51671 RepID=UPI0025E957DE|nr:ATP-binding cassette domain-containing protein [Microbacterium sp.]